MRSRIDHLAVVAATLEQGVAWCEQQLGVSPGPGGQHARMGTHNRLLALGPGLYMEIIAIDPQAGPPEFVRWFGMDDPELQQRVAVQPELRSFVVSCDDIARATHDLPRVGTPLPMQRGDLQWQISVRADGALQEGGALPVVIQWPKGMHPTAHMPDSGCRLHKLEVRHPDPESLERQWQTIGLQPDAMLHLERAEVTGLRAWIDTPHGMRSLGA